MEHTIAECGLRLSYVRDRRVIRGIDRQSLFDDLLEGVLPREASGWAVRPDIAAYDHLVLAHDLRTGKIIGLLGAHDHHATKGSFLWLDTGFVAQTARGQNLLRRMIAVMLIRVISLGGAPIAVATMTSSPVAVHVLQRMASWLSDARFAPTPESVVVDLGSVMLARDITAALGCRFAYGQANRSAAAGLEAAQAGQVNSYAGRAIFAASPMLAMLDLRNSSGTALITDLRKLYRMKPARALRTPPCLPSPDAAELALKLHAPGSPGR